jgi:hypothetical protein
MQEEVIDGQKKEEININKTEKIKTKKGVRK